jgi:trigger factor
MTDENRPDAATATSEPQPDTGAPAAADTGEAPEESGKLHQQVEIEDLGACRKRIKVTVERADIEARFGDHFKKLAKEANVAGFRPGKAPRRLVERRYQREVSSQVKNEVMMASLQQLGDDYDIAPLSEPDLDVEAIELPQEGPLVYEFEVEVRPQFDLPEYRGLKLKRPVKTFTEDDIAEQRRLLLTRFGQIVPKPEGNAQLGDILVADVTFRYQGREMTKSQEVQLRVERDVVFKDGMARKFGEQVKGAGAGDRRVVPVEISSASPDPSLVGKVIEAVFDIKEVKQITQPELTPEFLEIHFGVKTPGALDELILALLNRQLENTQRRFEKQQVLHLLSANAKWELPEDLLKRQAKRSVDRRIMEMRADGTSEEQINQQRRRLEQDILKSTAASLQEHFVLQKVAELEEINIDADDLNDEIERIAEQEGESARRVRARLERDDMMDALHTEMVERRALDLILDAAEYEDIPLDPQAEETAPLASAEVQAVPGELRDPVAAPPAEAGTSEPAADAGASPEGA